MIQLAAQLTDFPSLGTLIGVSKVGLAMNCINLGLFRDDETDSWFAASCTPWVIGMGSTIETAVSSWFEELEQTRVVARTLTPPLGAKQENDLQAIICAFGSL